MMRVYAKGEVLTMESYNSLLKQLIHRAKHIGLKLCSGRANLKKTMGVGARGASHKWSVIRPIATSILQDANDHVDDAGDVLNDPHRWNTPEPTKDFPSPASIRSKMKLVEPDAYRVTPRLIWASHYNKELHRLCPKRRASTAVAVHCESALYSGCKLMWPADKNYCQSDFMIGLARKQQHPPVNGEIVAGTSWIVQPELPLQFETGVDGLCHVHRQIQALSEAAANAADVQPPPEFHIWSFSLVWGIMPMVTGFLCGDILCQIVGNCYIVEKCIVCGPCVRRWTIGHRTQIGGWGGAQPGNRFVSFVRAYARSGCLVELDLKFRGFPLQKTTFA